MEIIVDKVERPEYTVELKLTESEYGNLCAALGVASRDAVYPSTREVASEVRQQLLTAKGL